MSNPPDEIEVDVTAEDIRRGGRYSACDCPIAHALKRAGHMYVRVNCGRADASLLVQIDGSEYHNATAATFAKDFDLGRPVKPCRITLSRVTP